MNGISVLVVEDEPLALNELVRHLGTFAEVRDVVTAPGTIQALRLLRSQSFDAVFLDLSMPELTGVELAGVLVRLAAPPAVVFVTASDAHAVAAFGVGAVDYLPKPVERGRIAEALQRIASARTDTHPPQDGPNAPDVFQVEDNGRIRFVRWEQVRVVEARGDYVRLYTSQGDFMVRMPLSTIEASWSHRGFVRVHRGFLVALASVVDLRIDASGRLTVRTHSVDAPVSRRHARQFKQQLMAAATRGELGGSRW